MADLKDIFKTMGASNHTDKVREVDDYYATDPKAIACLFDRIDFRGPVWEPACGGGHLSEAMAARGFKVKSSDLIDRGYGAPGVDFLKCTDSWDGDIVTNPPHKHAEKFVRKALDLTQDGRLTAMLLKLTFLEGKGRRKLFDVCPPRDVLVFSERLLCAKNGDFVTMRAAGGGIQAYAWFVWEKGFHGTSTIGWVN